MSDVESKIDHLMRLSEEGYEISSQMSELFFGKNVLSIAIALHLSRRIIQDVNPGFYEQAGELVDAICRKMEKKNTK